MSNICVHLILKGINKGKRCVDKESRDGYCRRHLQCKSVQRKLESQGIDETYADPENIKETCVNVENIKETCVNMENIKETCVDVENIKETCVNGENIKVPFRPHVPSMTYDELIVRCVNAGLETPYKVTEPIGSRQSCNCPVCNLSLSHKSGLMRHVRVVHLGEKYYKCDKCNYESASNNNLMKHSCRESNTQKRYIESEVKKRLQKELGGKELTCVMGRPDLVTDREVIEIKTWLEWKKGLGQILIYRVFWPTLTPRLHMFGLPATDICGKVMMAKHITESYGIVWTQEVDI